MSSLLLPTDLNRISSAAEMAKMDEERKLKQRKNQQQIDLREAFMGREVHSHVIERINRAVSVAAEQGRHEIQVMTFPSDYCSDGGRRINNADPEWPITLSGFARRAYEFFEMELRPHGYKIHAEIINFPDGMPGDVGLFLKW